MAATAGRRSGAPVTRAGLGFGTAAADCAAAQLLNATRDTVDAQGVTLRVVTSVPAVASCTNLSTLRVTVVAYDLADASRTPIADARTLIYLDGTP